MEPITKDIGLFEKKIEIFDRKRHNLLMNKICRLAPFHPLPV